MHAHNSRRCTDTLRKSTEAVWHNKQAAPLSLRMIILVRKSLVSKRIAVQDKIGLFGRAHILFFTNKKSIRDYNNTSLWLVSFSLFTPSIFSNIEKNMRKNSYSDDFFLR